MARLKCDHNKWPENPKSGFYFIKSEGSAEEQSNDMNLNCKK